MKCSGRKCQMVSIFMGILFIIFGYFLLVQWETILDNQLKKTPVGVISASDNPNVLSFEQKNRSTQIGTEFFLFLMVSAVTLALTKFILSKTSKTYHSWIKARVPIYCKFYFFNWTNPSYSSRPDYKPILDEVGPYVFLQTLEKVDVQFHDNGTVSYKLKRFWYFERSLSVGPLSDRITSVNPVAAAVRYSTRYSFSMSALTRIAIPDAFHSKTVKTVEELLFKGYEDKLISLGRFSQIFFSEMREIPYDRFGWWYPRNGSISEVYNMETGENGMDTFGELRSWNYQKKTKFYNGSCGDVSGSGGNFWPWNLTKSSKVLVFSADICRPISMTFSEELSYGGLPAYKYESGPDFVNNGMSDRKNECLCNGECVPPGVFNASSCSKDAPVFISYPHFRHADKDYTDSVIGMKPDKNKHNMYLILDPKYGVPLELSAPIQINLLIETTPKSSLENHVKKRLFFPVLWVDQSFRIKKEDLKTMILISNLPRIGFIVSLTVIILGASIIFACLLIRMIHKNRTKVVSLEVQTTKVNEEKEKEPNTVKHIKFNYFKDSNL